MSLCVEFWYLSFHLCHLEASTRGTAGIMLTPQIICIYFFLQGGKFATNPLSFWKALVLSLRDCFKDVADHWGQGRTSTCYCPHIPNPWASAAQTTNKHLSLSAFQKQKSSKDTHSIPTVRVVFAALQRSAWLHLSTSVPSKHFPPHHPVWPDKGLLMLWFSKGTGRHIKGSMVVPSAPRVQQIPHIYINKLPDCPKTYRLPMLQLWSFSRLYVEAFSVKCIQGVYLIEFTGFMESDEAVRAFAMTLMCRNYVMLNASLSL